MECLFKMKTLKKKSSSMHAGNKVMTFSENEFTYSSYIYSEKQLKDNKILLT